ncbi:polyribonucleotide nucleotidyltransferase [Alienimonas californiensis]|uniref:Polyribonucleotide nucleotidyltransferase n=1 Tax=Alienimonas californiensis TaxID=2527989 RepID=A0A517PCR9_9PLAN|nr:polyribonucleotide nucleotidyltransferase [Alienimonas californiensis]QDT17131.1 Polyribonucleotide nucleotidyltransferase [Alienimonas californiensis]
MPSKPKSLDLTPVSVEREIGGRKMSLSTGDLARQASGAVRLQFADTVLFIAAQRGAPRPGIDFFPLQVDYRERLAAAGRFAGGFLKREGRPTNKEILTARVTDRPIRPLFPKGYKDEIQVQANVLSSDGANDPAPLVSFGASAALMIAPVPFDGPIASVRVGRVDGELVLFPTQAEMAQSDLDLIVGGSKTSVLMIEGFAGQIPEDEMVEAIMFAHKTCVELCEMQDELCKKLGVKKTAFAKPIENVFAKALKKDGYDRLKEAKTSGDKADRSEAVEELRNELMADHFEGDAEEASNGGSRAEFKAAFYQLEHDVVRDLLLEGKRIDGRAPDELRALDVKVGVLPKVHGSAVFTRGETQSMCTITLGNTRDQQRVDGLFGEHSERFMLHYYFPSYSVGETRPIRGPGRREIGHGVLAERSVYPVLPHPEKFPYTIRCISDILESNGSSSMASVCSATLGLMDAGVPITQPVAGISIGLVKESDKKYTLLTDIMGDEDHFGDMDFKVAGTQKGITGIQLDLKIDGISEAIIRDALAQAKEARITLLRTMLGGIRRPRAELAPTAPRLLSTKIDPSKIGLLIGPGGKNIRALQEETGATLDVQDDGTVVIASDNAAGAEAALARVEAMGEDVKVGRVYNGKVTSIKDFGAFIEIAPGKDGLCHISELDEGFVKNVSDIVKVGETVEVKVIAVDDQGRVKLSRKALLVDDDEDGEDEDE